MAHTVCSTCSFLVVYLKFCTACCESVYMLIKGTCRGLILSERAYNRNILFVCFVFVYRWGWPFKGGGGAYNQHFKVLKGGFHGSAHVHESKYFFAFVRYGPNLFNLVRCLMDHSEGNR